MKILLITQYFPPEGGSCAALMGELAEELSERGHEISVVTGFPNYPAGKVYDGYRRTLVKKENNNKYKLIRTFLLITPKRHSFGPRMLNYLSFMASSFVGGLRAGRHDIIYFYSPPLFLGVTAGLLGKIWGAPVIMNLNDLWPRAPIALGVIRNPILVRVAGWLESFVYHNCDKIFTYSNKMRKEISKAGVAEDKIDIHNLWVDTAFFQAKSPEESEAIRQEYSLQGKFVVMYTGLVGMAQGLTVMVDAAEILQRQGNQDIMVMIVGGGPDREGLIRRAEDKGLKNIILIDQQPRERMAAFMAAADVLVSHLQGAPHRIGTIPAKILTYMVAGKPVLVGAEGEAADLVHRCDCGLAVPPDNAAAMARGILDLRALKDTRRKQMAKNSALVIAEKFEKTVVLDKLEHQLQEIVGKE